MRAVLVRVGVDQAFGHWNGPVDPETHEFVYVPIPEERPTLPDLATPYTTVASSLGGFAKERVVDAKACALSGALSGRQMHLDPDFKMPRTATTPTRGATSSTASERMTWSCSTRGCVRVVPAAPTALGSSSTRSSACTACPRSSSSRPWRNLAGTRTHTPAGLCRHPRM
ncbi:MAG: hypothetical protein KC464_35365 [Myxococcales bacterium]|nr:hypothetical protein [Myxococcales bacterium]